MPHLGAAPQQPRSCSCLPHTIRAVPPLLAHPPCLTLSPKLAPCRLLQQADPALRQLPQRCLHRLLEFARRPDQGRGDIVRRSGAWAWHTAWTQQLLGCKLHAHSNGPAHSWLVWLRSVCPPGFSHAPFKMLWLSVSPVQRACRLRWWPCVWCTPHLSSPCFYDPSCL